MTVAQPYDEESWLPEDMPELGGAGVVESTVCDPPEGMPEAKPFRGFTE